MNDAPIPFLDLSASHRELEEELVQAFRESLHSAAFIGGAQVEGFEREFAEYCGAPHCAGVASGTDALRFALMAAGVTAGDAVITVSHTFIATIEAISQAGASTEFVDIDERTCTMSPEALETYLRACSSDPVTGRPLGRRSGKQIKAVVPVHLYGQVADVAAILDVCQRFGLVMIEDACQAHGAEYRLDGRWGRAGSFGSAAAFSFYPGKNLGACGEGGAVTTSDSEIARKVKMLRDHGQTQKYHHDLEGYNGRLDAIQAAFLRIKLHRLDRWNSERRLAAVVYNELFEATPNAAAVTLPFESESSRSVYHLYVIRARERDALASQLREAGISVGLHYPIPVHLQKCYRDWGYGTGTLPVTESVAAEILSLPMFPGITLDQQERVVAAVSAFLNVSAGR